jgi:FkbM family methyltransferase
VDTDTATSGGRADPALAGWELWWRADSRAWLRKLPPARAAANILRLSSLILRQRIEGTSAAGVLVRLWSWQAWRRVVGRPAIIRCAEGSLLLAPSWSSMAGVLIGTGLTERDDALFVLDLLRQGDLFVDVGANIGFYTILAGRRGARVIAFEPAPDAVAAVQRSAELNGVGDGVRIRQAACGSSAGTTRFTTGLDLANHIVVGDEPSTEVRMVTLDDQLLHERAEMVMLKVDAEGHDLDVLRGAMDTITRLRPLIMVEIWTGGSGPRELLDGLGYRPCRYDPATRTLTEVDPGSLRAGNLLLVPEMRMDAARERVAHAERPALRPPAVRWRRALSR